MKRCQRCTDVWPRKSESPYAPAYWNGLVPIPTSRLRVRGFRSSMLCPDCGGTGYDDGREFLAHVARVGLFHPKKYALS